MKVSNMVSSKGNTVSNQFIITSKTHLGNDMETFQSYDTIIATRAYSDGGVYIELDADKWDYSKTTGKYRNQFLSEGIAETRKKIASGEYILTNLN